MLKDKLLIETRLQSTFVVCGRCQRNVIIMTDCAVVVLEFLKEETDFKTSPLIRVLKQ